jgi:hypothetical protein
MLLLGVLFAELVMNRSMNPTWYGSVESTYFLYPVHVSLSFLFSPTLSSSLYILLLRFLNRNYEEVFRLAATIGTDIEYGPEEDVIFKCLGRLNGDCHPDAHACRLKIALVIFDSPVLCPFDITVQMSRYVTKLSHVSAVCRLTLPEELMLLETCVSDSSDPRFIDPETGFPRYTVYEITMVKNRKYYLRALLAGQDFSETFLVPRNQGSRWPCDRNIAAVMMDDSAFLSLEVTYSAPNQSSANAALDVINKFWPGQEDMAGHAHGLGFLYLYELMTGTKQCKILSTNNSISVARLLFEMTSDKSETALLPSILNLMSRFPQLIPLMPKYVDRRSQKTATISGVGNDVDLISPLGQLLAAVLHTIQSEIADILVEGPEFNEHPAEQSPICSVNKKPWTAFNIQQDMGRSTQTGVSLPNVIVDSKERWDCWIIPSISNFSCGSRQLHDITVSDSAAVNNVVNLSLNVEEIDRFSSNPLSSLDLKQFVSFVSRADIDLPSISGTLPFDVEGHEQAKSAIAQSMLQRLRTDMAEFATAFNSEKSPKLSCLLPIERINNVITAALRSDNSISAVDLVARLNEAHRSVSSVLSELENLRSVDSKYVESALPWLLAAANDVSLGPVASSSASGADAMEVVSEKAETEPRQDNKVLFLLKRFCRQEVTLWLEFLFGSLLSSVQSFDLQLLNPFLSQGQINLITSVVVASIFHANRIGMINRCIADARDLVLNLSNLSATLTVQHEVVHNDRLYMPTSLKLIAASLLKGESLARNLCVGRHYIDVSDMNGGESKRRRTDGMYDPRFLLFEFTW